MGSAFGEAVITEPVFGWPGLGQLLIEAVQSQDFPIVHVAINMAEKGDVVVIDRNGDDKHACWAA